jgi:hypothetical protein
MKHPQLKGQEKKEDTLGNFAQKNQNNQQVNKRPKDT